MKARTRSRLPSKPGDSSKVSADIAASSSFRKPSIWSGNCSATQASITPKSLANRNSPPGMTDRLPHCGFRSNSSHEMRSCRNNFASGPSGFSDGGRKFVTACSPTSCRRPRSW